MPIIRKTGYLFNILLIYIDFVMKDFKGKKDEGNQLTYNY